MDHTEIWSLVITAQPAAGPGTTSSSRLNGDWYQNLITWGFAMRLVLPDSPYTNMEIESRDAAHVDDIVLHSTSEPPHYFQVKWTNTPASPVNFDYLTARKSKKGRSLLEKFFISWRKLSLDGRRPTLTLITNRVPDLNDPILSLLDGRDDRVSRVCHQSSKQAVQSALSRWTDHLNCERDELCEMLRSLVFWTGLSVTSEIDRVKALMSANGLQYDHEAVEIGWSVVHGWVRKGVTEVTSDHVTRVINERDLPARRPQAELVIQAIDWVSDLDGATAVCDWVDLHEGHDADSRRQAREPASWLAMSDDLDRAVNEIRSTGAGHVHVRGALRQATFFTVGARLRHVTGMSVSCIQNGRLWSSDAAGLSLLDPNTSVTPMNAGSDLAVAIGIAADPTPALTKYIEEAGLPVHTLLVVMPHSGRPDDQAIKTVGHAVTYARMIRDKVREHLEDSAIDTEQIHLFFAGPGGLALLLGHRWNCLRPTVAYEHLGPGKGYVPAFTVSA